MKRLNFKIALIFSIFFLISLNLIPFLLTGQKAYDPVTGKDYRLVWAQEFLTDGYPDTAVWVPEIGNGRDGWGNQELEYYTARPENAVCRDGNLIITAIKEPYEGWGYTSARLKTKGNFSFCYGLIEFRAKLPGGTGIWPALWMLGDNIEEAGWPASGEIDVMEYAGKDLNLIHGSLHTLSSCGNTINTKTTIIPGVEEEFHVYAMEWTEKEITFLIDGNAFYTYKPATYNDSTWPFYKPFFILVNVAVGGGFGGPVDPGIFPQSMIVDYIRVYQENSRD
jgi:beta-glucanase (GH16 family)